MPFAPYSGYATLAFLVGVLALMFFDKVQGPWMLGAMAIGIPASSAAGIWCATV